jgi:hypothetical protein
MPIFVIAAPIFAQVNTSAQDNWQFEATPYVWAAGMNGWTRLGARTPTAKIDPSFSDIWRNLDIGAMASFKGCVAIRSATQQSCSMIRIPYATNE